MKYVKCKCHIQILVEDISQQLLEYFSRLEMTLFGMQKEKMWREMLKSISDEASAFSLSDKIGDMVNRGENVPYKQQNCSIYLSSLL